MLGWVVSGSPGGPGRLVSVERDEPAPGPSEVLVRVQVCGACRTDLHLADGDLPPQGAVTDPRARGGGGGCRTWRECLPVSGRGPCRHRLASRNLRCVVRVGEDARTSAGPRRSPAWTPTAAMRSTPWSTRDSPTRCPQVSLRRASRRCCARGSSVTALSSGRSCPPVAAWDLWVQGQRPPHGPAGAGSRS